MNHRLLHLSDLSISPSDVYRQMGYGDTLPAPDVAAEVQAVMREAEACLAAAAPAALPQFCFFVGRGTLAGAQLDFLSQRFGIGSIIARQLRGAEAYAFFMATAGTAYEQWRRQDDLVRTYVADALGSVMAERCADRMEEALQASIGKLGWQHSNRFSPGYCGWPVAEQQLLFPLFGQPNPCGISLTASSLMLPIKSVSGVIGVGAQVRHLDYACGLCDMAHCFKRRSG